MAQRWVRGYVLACLFLEDPWAAISLNDESKRKSDQSVIVLVSYRMYLNVAWLCPEIGLAGWSNIM